MKVVKIILLAAGLITLAVGAWMLFMTVRVDLKIIWEIATRYSTTTNLVDPRQNLLVLTGVALAAGLLLGLAAGLPLRFAPSEKKLDELVEARVQQRLAPATPVVEDTTPPADPTI